MNNVKWLFEQWEKDPLPEFFVNDVSNAIVCTKEGIARQIAAIKQFPSLIFVALKENGDVAIKKMVVNGENKDEQK